MNFHMLPSQLLDYYGSEWSKSFPPAKKLFFDIMINNRMGAKGPGSATVKDKIMEKRKAFEQPWL